MEMYDVDYERLRDAIDAMHMTEDFMLIDMPDDLAKEICHNLNLTWNDCRSSSKTPCGFRKLPADFYHDNTANIMDVYNVAVFKNAGFHCCGQLSDFVSMSQFNAAELLDLLEV